MTGTRAVTRKQVIRDQATWHTARARARETWPDQRLDSLIAQTVEDITRTCAGEHPAVCWSGGKDSLALAWCAGQAGITESLLVISDLEYPAFLQWVTDQMPDGLTVLSTGQDLTWLAEHPAALFPPDSGTAGRHWFSYVWRKQAEYYRSNNLTLLMYGRRRCDGNYIGPNEGRPYTDKHGVTRFLPLAWWPHEAVFALIDRENILLPPTYSWPRGFQVGTGAWPARQWTENRDQGWEEVWQIDPEMIRQAAPLIPGAAEWADRTGRL
jgi:3'-phosphoadenosine 5'-phosphosulfate sulfotransferase (PAPS reductase)/FAD synthetase